MYYKEKVIGDTLYFKTAPDGEWNPVAYEEVLRRMVKAEKEASQHALNDDLAVCAEQATCPAFDSRCGEHTSCFVAAKRVS